MCRNLRAPCAVTSAPRRRTARPYISTAEDDIFAPGGLARGFLDSHFSIPHMLRQYVGFAAKVFEAMPSSEARAGQSLRAA